MSDLNGTWAHDLADVGAVYPMQGSEVLMVVVVMVLWVVWHVVQISGEQKQQRDDVNKYGKPENLSDNLED